MSSSQPHDSSFSAEGGLFLPDAPALVPVRRAHAAALLVTPDGEVEELDAEAAMRQLAHEPTLVMHAPFLLRRIALRLNRPARAGDMGVRLLDLIELFAFVHPARACVPTSAGLAKALGLKLPVNPEQEAFSLHEAARRLLASLADPHYPNRIGTARTAFRMAEGGWAWGPGVMAALADVNAHEKRTASFGLDIWNDLPEWEDRAPLPPASSLPVTGDEARERLDMLTGHAAERREGQSDFAAMAAFAFAPREARDAPNVVLAEAGTGIGKTLGYIAPASLWAERNKGTVWISTYTKNLQRQLDQELSKLYPNPGQKAEKAVIRKGRENYLCLLNYAELADRAAMGVGLTPIGLVARWARASRDGDMVGGDFPSWLNARLSGLSLTDRRGECIYSACPYYNKCFIEKAIRKARRAEIVIANHALVMRQAALERMSVAPPPKTDAAAGVEDIEPTGREAHSRFVFDEGHHLFDAADGAFAAQLSCLETAELRRWVRGPEMQRGRRGRGLEDRIGDLISDDDVAGEAMQRVLSAAAALPSPGWAERIRGGGPRGDAEGFFALVRAQTLARVEETEAQFSLETDTLPLVEGLAETAAALHQSLGVLSHQLLVIADRLRIKLDENADSLESQTRTRIDAAARGLERRGRALIPVWRSMLASLGQEPPEAYIDWLSIERIQGREIDIAFNRHWRDPTIPFAEAVLTPAHGALITSATLRDQLPAESAEDEGWESAEIRTGAAHLVLPAKRAFMPSPFDYEKQAQILIVRDVGRDMNAIASAYRELFLAAGGGALGLFTAVHRLRAVYERLAMPIEAAGLPLYAQHVDALDTSTLVDIFRAERNACLLGTDAVRDGVDVPGDSLRLIVFDRTPWPRPDILHKARRALFGKARYDDMLTRLRLKQAFGRLIRSGKDRGVFVMLDSRLPSRLLSAFPPGAHIERVGLADAIERTAAFFGHDK